MMTMMPALLSAALLLPLLPWTLSENSELLPIDIVVKNSLQNKVPLTFTTQVAYRGILLGAMKRLMDSNADFKFTYTENLNYGPYLESVNGVAGNDADRTYWELLAKNTKGEFERTDVGIGCYIPSPHQQILLNFTKW